MRYFTITVNGKTYSVQVEETSTPVAAPVYAPAPVAAAPAPIAAAPAPAPAAAAEAPAAPAASGTQGSIVINSPMPGTIIDIKVAVGQAVKSGDVLCILEAMKMENEILAPSDGTIASLNVTKGGSVDSGDVIITLS